MKKTAAVFTLMIMLSTTGMLFTACSKTGSAVNAGRPAIVSEYETDKTNDSIDTNDILSCKYFNDKDFRASVSNADALKHKTEIITGGIVPHHLLACDMIARFFKTVSTSEPEVIVVIAPNHKRSGNAKISTGDWSWQTAFGKLDAEKKLVEYLVDRKAAATSFGLLEEDHSIAALVPYIKYYMPSAKIVPVMLHGNLGQKESEKLGNDLSEQLKDRKSLIIASVDFSHYLSPEKAEIMDKSTLEAIMAMDMETIGRMGNDNLDSPPSIMTLISFMKSAKAAKPEMLEHGNSSTITGKWSSSTTSYFTIVY